MKKVLITMLLLSVFVVVSCITDETDDTGNTGDSGKFSHSHAGLNWSDASSDKMNWDEAVTYCKDLGGRLPTISELRTLIQNCPATETGGECGVTDSCLGDSCWNTPPCNGCTSDSSGKYSVFGDTVRLWSSSSNVSDASRAWFVNFYSGYVYYDDKPGNGYARCAR